MDNNNKLNPADILLKNISETELVQNNIMPTTNSIAQVFDINDENFINDDGQFSTALKAEAFHGVAGEVVRAIDPHSEAHPAAILADFLTYMGSMCGCNVYFVHETKKHYPRLYVATIGPTAKGRKGTAYENVKFIMDQVDEGYGKNNILTNLSTGEGLIENVRDPLTKKVDGQDIQIDEGVKDKRKLIVEQEMSWLLQTSNRMGNTTSSVLRLAWDGGDLQITNRNSPVKATNAHISVIGMSTKEEVLTKMHENELYNGFANRFLWFHVIRSKKLPYGGNLHEQHEKIEYLTKKIIKVLEYAKQPRELKRNKLASSIWASIYGSLSEGVSGIVGKVTSRAEAQVMRLALVYAILDCSNEINEKHLLAALSVWDYSFKSARYIFGNNEIEKNENANKIMEALKVHKKMTKTEIIKLFHNNISKKALDKVCTELIENGYVQVVKEKIGNSKKPTQFLQLLNM